MTRCARSCRPACAARLKISLARCATSRHPKPRTSTATASWWTAAGAPNRRATCTIDLKRLQSIQGQARRSSPSSDFDSFLQVVDGYGNNPIDDFRGCTVLGRHHGLPLRREARFRIGLALPKIDALHVTCLGEDIVLAHEPALAQVQRRRGLEHGDCLLERPAVRQLVRENRYDHRALLCMENKQAIKIPRLGLRCFMAH